MSSRLRVELIDKNYRDAFVSSTVRDGIAFQLKAMRNARNWDQKKLAAEMGNAKLQPAISRYENPDYGRFSISTLLEFAKAFDVGLIVRFAPFSEMLRRDEQLTEAPIDVHSYSQEFENGLLNDFHEKQKYTSGIMDALSMDHQTGMRFASMEKTLDQTSDCENGSDWLYFHDISPLAQIGDKTWKSQQCC